MKLKKKDLVIHSSDVIATVLKVYKDQETGQEFIQGLTDDGTIIYDKDQEFKLLDCLRLRCNSCDKEAHEVDLDVNEENGMYICECGSSTFTPLNLDEIYKY